MKIFVLTDIPSPYQAEIFNAITELGSCDLHVVYLRRADPERQWNEINIQHHSTILDGDSDRLSLTRRSLKDADLAVFNYYLHPHAEYLMSERALWGRPWCFWGERPGLRKPEWVGRLVRSWKLKSLHSSGAPIWGIGQFAVDRYKAEFGSRREYFNLPYFSNLQRFEVGDHANGHSPSQRVFIYSGALIPRKGVDLLAQSFNQLVREGYNTTLRIVGDGPMRNQLQALLADVGSRVEFVGFKDWTDLPKQYATADILCIPSRYDGWGMVVPEGLASGLPVISTDRVGAALEFIKSGRNGWLVREGDADMLLNAMRAAASLSCEDLSELSANARASVCEHTLQAGAGRFVSYANNVVANWRV